MNDHNSIPGSLQESFPLLADQDAAALENADGSRNLEHKVEQRIAELEAARAAAEEANVAKSAFLANVSHELRTPLTSILGFARIVQKRLEEVILPNTQLPDYKAERAVQQVRDDLEIILSEGQRLTALINNVLDLEKIEAGKMEWRIETLLLPDILHQATSATTALFEEKGLRFVQDIPAILPPVKGDRDRLVQVVVNLLSNAVKFTPEGQVTLRAQARDAEVWVSVIDSGVGIAAQDLPVIFEQFKQAGDTLTAKPRGTGLGLAICKEIVEHHGGRIWVESQPGSGSTFTFALPVTAYPASGPAIAPTVDLNALLKQMAQHHAVTKPASILEQKLILIVDDDPHIRELLRQELEAADYLVCEAVDGREALISTRCGPPDLIILDAQMPGLNGFDVATVLKNDPLTMGIPIMMLTIAEEQERGYRLGIDRYLTKPIDLKVLLAEISNMLAGNISHRKMLVIEEDASTLATVSLALEGQGYQVLQASTATQGIQQAISDPPDMVIANAALAQGHNLAQALRLEEGLRDIFILLYQAPVAEEASSE